MAIDQLQFNNFKALLRAYRKKDTRKLRALLLSGGQPLQRAIREVAFNLLQGNVRLKPHQASRLKRFKTCVRNLAKKKTSLKKRLLIEQKGGFLSALLGPLMSILPGIIGAIIPK